MIDAHAGDYPRSAHELYDSCRGSSANTSGSSTRPPGQLVDVEEPAVPAPRGSKVERTSLRSSGVGHRKRVLVGHRHVVWATMSTSRFQTRRRREIPLAPAPRPSGVRHPGRGIHDRP